MDKVATNNHYLKTTLKNITTKIGSGATPTGGKNSYKNCGISLIRSLNVYDFKFEYEDLALIDDEQAAGLSNVQVERYDLLLNITGASVARCCMVPEEVLPARVNQHVAIVRINPKIADPYYVLYCLNSYRYKQKLLSIAQGGATREALTKEKIENFEISLPSPTVQHKIASILSAYDDLIENNNRRIKILEEMAQAIYKEWFTYPFRGVMGIPSPHPSPSGRGSYKASKGPYRLVKSELGMIPEGWEVKKLEEILSEIESGSRPKGGIDPSERGMPSIGAENVLGLGKYDYTKEKYVSQEFYEKMRRGRIKSKDILLYKDGAQIGRKSMFRDSFPHETCCTNEHIFILRTNEQCTQNYLYFWLDQPEMTQKIRNLNANAAQPGINQMGVKGLPILLPPKSFIDAFENIAEPLIAKLFNLAKKNNNLRKTRDLFLPKLISGEIDVENLDIKRNTVEDVL